MGTFRFPVAAQRSVLGIPFKRFLASGIGPAGSRGIPREFQGHACCRTAGDLDDTGRLGLDSTADLQQRPQRRADDPGGFGLSAGMSAVPSSPDGSARTRLRGLVGLDS